MFRLALAERQWLEQVETRHAETLSALVCRCQDRLLQWETWPTLALSPAGARAWITQLRDENARNHSFTCGIWDDGSLVGLVALAEVSVESLSGLLWGFVCPEVEGTGTAVKASVGFLNFAFCELALARVNYFCAVDNHRSVRLAARLGFTHEGTIPSWRVIGGKLVDFHVHGLLRGDWTRVRNECLHLRVARARDEDAPWLQSAFGEPPSVADPNRPVWVVPGQAAARLRFEQPGVAWLERFAATGDESGPDAARALLRAIEAELRIRGVTLLCVDLSRETETRRLFFEHHGFRPVGDHTGVKGV